MCSDIGDRPAGKPSMPAPTDREKIKAPSAARRHCAERLVVRKMPLGHAASPAVPDTDGCSAAVARSGLVIVRDDPRLCGPFCGKRRRQFTASVGGHVHVKCGRDAAAALWSSGPDVAGRLCVAGLVPDGSARPLCRADTIQITQPAAVAAFTEVV